MSAIKWSYRQAQRQLAQGFKLSSQPLRPHHPHLAFCTLRFRWFMLIQVEFVAFWSYLQILQEAANDLHVRLQIQTEAHDKGLYLWDLWGILFHNS